MRFLNIIICALCIVKKEFECTPTARTPNMEKLLNNALNVDPRASIRKHQVDPIKTQDNIGKIALCELFLCDTKSRHCDFISNATIADDNNLDCHHNYLKIYITITDFCLQKEDTFYAYIPNHLDDDDYEIAQVAGEPRNSKECEEILKYLKFDMK